MKRFFQILLFFLLVSVLCVTAIACGGGADPTDSTAGEETTVASEGNVLLSDLAKMQIVYDADGGDAFLELAEQIRDAIKEATGISLKVYPDAFYSEKEHEIVLGPCVGRASETAVKALRVNDYFCMIDGTKITLGAITSEALGAVTEYFTKNVIDAYKENKNGVFCIADEVSTSFSGTYDVESITLGGIDISEFVIVYPRKELNFENEYAEALAAQIEAVSGYRIPVYKDSQEWSQTYELHIGLSASDAEYAGALSLKPDAYVIERVENKVILASSTTSGYTCGTRALLSMLSAEAATDGKLAIDLSEKLTAVGNDLEIRVMSYNIYYSLLEEPRMSHVIEMIEKHDPDVLGVQEAPYTWKTYLKEHLGDVYDIVGEGRDGGSLGEHNLILYRKDMFNLVESGTYWLSATPEDPSKFKESSLKRIVTYAVLERKSDGKQFVHFNTHLEHTSNVAREKQVAVLLEIAAEYKDLPITMTGDFNAKKNRDEIRMILNAGYADSYDVAVNAVKENTNGDGSAVIDYCFVTPEAVKVLKYRVDTFKYSEEERDPSDHSPVIVDVLIR